ncbi:MAG: hypothetical protein JWO52_2077, partial [Gammaproteobacteria bacterium]|nr:hypothetical protein [Gammaproteobacteria bacterium]
SLSKSVRSTHLPDQRLCRESSSWVCRRRSVALLRPTDASERGCSAGIPGRGSFNRSAMTTFPSNLLADGLIGTRDLALLFAFSSGGRRQSEVASAVIGRTVGTRARKAPGVTVGRQKPLPGRVPRLRTRTHKALRSNRPRDQPISFEQP